MLWTDQLVHTLMTIILRLNALMQWWQTESSIGGMSHSHRLPPAEPSHRKPKPDASAAAVMGMTKPHLLQQMRFNFNEK